jgi:DNA helicase-2/ATP-dependent DNA helicase PcrA
MAGVMLDGLDDDQRAAATAPRGPVCVLAGAGTGKTRTITHRIAHLVRTGHVAPGQVLAVTFTARAAGEMRTRLRALGVSGVQARTFHAAALRQLRYFWPRVVGGPQWQLVEGKLRIVGHAAGRARMGTDAATLRDLAGEIEWAKASLVTPAEYPAAVARLRRDVPGPAEQVAAVYAGYEEAKNAAELLDFDDLLLHVAGALEGHADIAEEFRDRYRCFVVDEYQDVTPLQQRVLDAWLGERDDITVVGDANQTIYTVRRGQPEAPAGVPAALPRGRRRAAAARLPLHPAGRRVRQHAHRRGPRPARGHPAAADRPAPGGPRPGFHRVRRRGGRGGRGRHPHPADDRRRGAAERDRRAVPGQRAVRDLRAGAHRGGRALPGARRRAVLPPARDPPGHERRPHGRARDRVRAGRRRARRARARRLTPDPPGGAAQRAQWESLLALVELAEELAGVEPEADLRRFAAELETRADAAHPPTVQGVTLASLHAAKGLEWDVVFLVGLVDGTLPIQHAEGDEHAIEEERRLLYVGITRARRQVLLSWALSRQPGGARRRRRSRFLYGLVPRAPPGVAHRPRRTRRGQAALPGLRFSARRGGCAEAAALRRLPSDVDTELLDRLRSWRSDEARDQQVPAYVVFTDATLTAIAEHRPVDRAALVGIPGIGSRKLDRYGAAVLALVADVD